MNDLDLCLEVVSRSRQPLRYIWRWLSRKSLEIKALFRRTTSRKWHMGYPMVTWPMTSRDTQRFCEAVRSAILATVWLLVSIYIRVLDFSLHLVNSCDCHLLSQMNIWWWWCNWAQLYSRTENSGTWHEPCNVIGWPVFCCARNELASIIFMQVSCTSFWYNVLTVCRRHKD